jgi:hypothetical protein
MRARAHLIGLRSALQWFFGRDLQRSLKPPRPIGLIEASLGGTPIQAWSSATALSSPCSFTAGGGEARTQVNNGGLWNGLIEPILASSIRGAIWCKRCFCHAVFANVYIRCCGQIKERVTRERMDAHTVVRCLQWCSYPPPSLCVCVVAIYFVYAT